MRVKYLGNVKPMSVMKANARKNTRRSKLATALNTDLSHKIIFKIDLRGSEFVDLYQNFHSPQLFAASCQRAIVLVSLKPFFQDVTNLSESCLMHDKNEPAWRQLITLR